jgi:hypothetical protein
VAIYQLIIVKNIFQKYPKAGIAGLISFTTFTLVFHRILDFKNGAGCLSGPLLVFYGRKAQMAFGDH